MSRRVSLACIALACTWVWSCGGSSTDPGGAGAGDSAGGAEARGGAAHGGSNSSGAAHGGSSAAAGAAESTAGRAEGNDGGASDGGASDGGAAGQTEPPPPFEPWALWPMPNATSSGLPHPASYDASAAGEVLDKVTGLTWQAVASTSTFTWNAAQAHCVQLVLGGFSDWRLPSRIELISIVDYTIAKPGPVIDTTAFPGAPNTIFWTASPEALYGGSRAWYVQFDNGFAFTDGSDTRYAARCVR